MKKLRMILPVAAVVFAAAGAWATNASDKASLNEPVPVSIIDALPSCLQTHACIPGGESPCTFGELTFAERVDDNQTITCSVPFIGTYDE